MSNISAIVLAAGKGTRMNSDKPKVLHKIGGRPMIDYTLDTLEQLGISETILVVGYGAEEIKSHLANRCKYALQENPAGGTGDAARVGLTEVSKDAETVMILYGDDTAFYKVETLKKFLEFHQTGNLISDIVAEKPQTERVGRMILDSDGNFEKTMEVWEYEKSGLKTDLVNCGVYLFNRNWLEEHIGKLDNNNDKKEYRITELLNMAHEEGEKVGLFKLEDPTEWVGVNTMEDLEKANRLFKGSHP